MVGLIDCNSFYASCEQVFRPDLKNRPVVVLSNNDGCIIAANKEAKALAHIPMFEPVFKIKDQLIKNNVVFFSSNYTLYGEMSQRVMNILKDFSPLVEIYSIDESFISLEGMHHYDLEQYGHAIKDTILRNTGLPVGVGIATTKVLAKLANKEAKSNTENNHVLLINSDEERIGLLKRSPIKNVWGIGRKHVKRLNAVGVLTAHDFTCKPLAWVRKEMTVVGERLWRELRGEPCLEINQFPKSKKAIGTAKSFGKKLEDLSVIEEACAYYITEVSEVLRAQKSCAGQIQVFLQTNYHSNIDEQYSKSIVITLPYPTNNTFMLISHANKGLHHIFKNGYRYKKVGVNLLGLVPQQHVQGNLFESFPKTGIDPLIKTIDALNNKYGKYKVSSALLGNRKEDWELIKKERSPRYTTQWDEILTINAK